ncbi:EutP/PduV family microcompartment system protein [Provencibacterium massiliense]|uniref:EutP/PduV family microcompartment system protein n=1 Tax=Provencibacterium massiliense TaxID=1841868 RepID=UPI001FA8D524|nr:EutP/PduV family microcompartment system protein [Provencibacterium massiliense]
MLVGRTSCGKTSFCQAMRGQELRYQKTQMVQVVGSAIDTPGEYIENRSLYRALVVTAADADLIVLVQSATDEQSVFAPGFVSMFQKPAIGLVTKVDLAPDTACRERAAQWLGLAGCGQVFMVSNLSGEGVREVLAYLEGLGWEGDR